MRLARRCLDCSNRTTNSSGKCWRHEKAENPNSMAFLTKPGNEKLLEMHLSKIITGEDMSDEYVDYMESVQVPLPGLEPEHPLISVPMPLQMPAPEKMIQRKLPKYCIYRNKRVRVVGVDPDSDSRIEIIFDEARTTVPWDQIRFLKNA